MRMLLSTSAIALALITPAAHAASRPTVVELFTSEGCSSCPPADELLSSLAARSDLLPLAFHVTYWNSLGWRDPYSFDAATSRQALYAARLGGGSYTPEMVVDGRRGMVGSEDGEVAAAIVSAKGAEGPVLPIKLQRTGGGVKIDIGQGGAREGRIMLIGFDPRHETHVGRGENGGRTLIESNVVRSMQTVGDYKGAPVEVTASPGAGSDVAVIVQGMDGRIMGAARL